MTPYVQQDTQSTECLTHNHYNYQPLVHMMTKQYQLT